EAKAVQLGDDARQRRADDGLVHRGEQDREHYARQRDDELAPVQLWWAARFGGRAIACRCAPADDKRRLTVWAVVCPRGHNVLPGLEGLQLARVVSVVAHAYHL